MSAEGLPEELLRKVFQNLSLSKRVAVQGVNKKWKELSLQDVKQISFFGNGVDELSRFFFNFKKDSTAVKVNKWEQVDSLLQKCGKIDCVEFFDCKFEDKTHLNNIAQKLTAVSTLRFYFFLNPWIDDNNLRLLISQTSLVKKFTLIFDTIRYSSKNIKLIVDELLTRNCNVETLQLRANDVRFNCELLPALKEFNIAKSGVFALPENGISQLLLKSKNTLEILRYRIERNEDFELITQFTKLTDLRLDLVMMNSDGFHRFKFENLIHLNLKIYAKVDIESVISAVYRNQRLKTLYLRFQSWLPGNQSVNISNICNNFKELSSVALYPFNAYESCLQSLTNLPKLEYLAFGKCSSLQDRNLADFVNQVPLLRGLAVYQCDERKNTTLEAMKVKANNNESKYYFACLPVNKHILLGLPKNLKFKDDISESAAIQKQWDHFYVVHNNASQNDDFHAWERYAHNFLQSEDIRVHNPHSYDYDGYHYYYDYYDRNSSPDLEWYEIDPDAVRRYNED